MRRSPSARALCLTLILEGVHGFSLCNPITYGETQYRLRHPEDPKNEGCSFWNYDVRLSSNLRRWLLLTHVSSVPRIHDSRSLPTLSVHLGVSATTKDAGAAQHHGDERVGYSSVLRMPLLRLGAAGYGGEEVAGEGRGLRAAACGAIARCAGLDGVRWRAVRHSRRGRSVAGVVVRMGLVETFDP